MCVGVSEALCAEVASGTNLYLDLKLERETWWQREEGKLPQNVHNVHKTERLAWQKRKLQTQTQLNC